ncbi:unnamed protein product [Lampetra planeri]
MLRAQRRPLGHPGPAPLPPDKRAELLQGANAAPLGDGIRVPVRRPDRRAVASPSLPAVTAAHAVSSQHHEGNSCTH